MVATPVPLGLRIQLLVGGKSTRFAWIWIGLVAASGVAMHVIDHTPRPGEAPMAPYNHESCTGIFVVMSLGFAMMSYEVISGLRTLALLRRRAEVRAVMAHAEVEGRITRITLDYELPAGVPRQAKRVYRDAFGLGQATWMPIFVDTDNPDEIRTRFDLPDSAMAPNGALAPSDASDWLLLVLPLIAFGTMMTFVAYLIGDWIS